jgi:hypothetical protein
MLLRIGVRFKRKPGINILGCRHQRRFKRTVMVIVNAITVTTVITMVIIGPPFRPKLDSTTR